MALPFTPSYIFENELAFYGLPTPDVQPDIMSSVQMASALVDQECGRIDGDGNGSLVYTTYTQRILFGTRNRNLVYVSAKPMSPVSQADVDILAALAEASSSGNYYYTGVLANTMNGPAGTLSAIVGASGRYGYTRQDMSIAYPDLFAFINPLNLITMFGGPAPWVSIDVTQTDYDPKTGELWVPAGLQLQRYSELLIQYNSGYNPLRIPTQIKWVVASIVKNSLAKGDGTTGLVSLTMGKGANFSMYQKLLDPTLDAMLQPFRVVRGY